MTENNPFIDFKNADLTAEEINARIVQWSPSLDKLNKAGQTLKDYFDPIATWGRSAVYPLQARAMDLIHDRTDRLYGKDIARELRAQLDSHPICESGTHISFPRNYDSANHVTYDNDLVWQGAMLSASLYRHAKMRIHFGFYSSRVPIRNTNSAELAQLTPGKQLTRFTPSKKADNILMFAEPISEKRLQEARSEHAEYFFQRRLKEASQNLSCASSLSPQLMSSWESFLSKERALSDRNDYTLQKIEADLKADNIPLTDHALELQYAHNLLDCLASPLARKNEKCGFADQVMAVQTKLMNSILPNDIRQVVIDFTDISMILMAEAFRDKNSFWYKTFANPETRDKFVYGMAGIRTGWATDPETGAMQSPFLTVGSAKDVTKLYKTDYQSHKAGYSPEQIAFDLEHRKIIPTTALEVAFMLMETGISCHGGMFQAIYAPDIQSKLSSYLRSCGEDARAASLERMPLDLATQSPCFGLAHGSQGRRLLRFSDFMKNALSKEEADKIPYIETRTALGIASPTLHNFFSFYEPYITNGIQELASDSSAQAIYDDLQANSSFLIRKQRARSVTSTLTLDAR